MAIINSDDISIEAIKPKDILSVIEWSAKTRDSFFLLNSPLPITGEDLTLELAANNRKLFIVKNNNGQNIGALRAYSINTKDNHALVSFTLMPSQNNTKLMQAALEQLLEILFKKQNMRKIFSHCFTYEKEYIQVLSKLLFKKEGVYKEHFFMNNQYYDLNIFGLSREEYYG